MKFYSVLIAGLLMAATTLSAQTQKFGHVNSGNLLEMLPEVKNADTELGKLREQLFKDRDAKFAAFQEKYQKAIEAFNSGNLSPKQQQEQEQMIRAEQEKLGQLEQNIQLQIGKKREELLQPILNKLDEAIQAVGKEGGYTMIFDTASGGMLFAAEAEDVTPKVKKKLGLGG